jgi:hypothetical protein
MAFKCGVIQGPIVLNNSALGVNTTNIATGSTGAVAIGNTNSGAVNIVAGISTISLGNTASAAHTCTIGTTNTTSTLALKCGVGGFRTESATGITIHAESTGEINFPLQPAFLASKANNQNNVFGTGELITCDYDDEIFDQSGDYDGTNTFTCPQSGVYTFAFAVSISQMSTTSATLDMRLYTDNRTYSTAIINAGIVQTNGLATVINGTVMCNNDAGDICRIDVYLGGMATKTADMTTYGPYFSGWLTC